MALLAGLLAEERSSVFPVTLRSLLVALVHVILVTFFPSTDPVKATLQGSWLVMVVVMLISPSYSSSGNMTGFHIKAWWGWRSKRTCFYSGLLHYHSLDLKSNCCLMALISLPVITGNATQHPNYHCASIFNQIVSEDTNHKEQWLRAKPETHWTCPHQCDRLDFMAMRIASFQWSPNGGVGWHSLLVSRV